MWASFLLAFLSFITLLYLPGFLIARSFFRSTFSSLICGPVVSIFLYECLAIALPYFGIGASFATIVVPCLFAGIIALAVKFAKRGSRSLLAEKARHISILKRPWLPILLYIGFASIISVIYFIRPLEGAFSFNQSPDNVYHLGLIHSFLESGIFSPLTANLYPVIEGVEEGPVTSAGSFYPAAWHCLVALTASAVGCPTTVAVNASLFSLTAVVFPLSTFALLNRLFASRPSVVIAGAFTSIGFAAFPWWLVYFGPLYPNLASLTLVPNVASIFIAMFDKYSSARFNIAYAIMFLVGIADLALLQPNGVFSLAVILFPYCVYLLWRKTQSSLSNLARILCCTAFVLAAIACWYLLYLAPFMQSVVNYPWGSFESARQEVVNIALLAYRAPQAQPALALLVALGIMFTIKNRKFLWITASYAIATIMMFVCATTDGKLDAILTGFWYTDPYRIAATCALAALPLAALGGSVVFNLLERCWELLASDTREKTAHSKVAISAGLALLFAAVTFYPNHSIPGYATINTAFGEIEENAISTNKALSYSVLTDEERHFLQEVSSVVPKGALILNKPDDGSVFGYALYDLNLVYRKTGIEAYNTDPDDSKTMRLSIDKIATDGSVSETARSYNLRYVLVLDQGQDPNEGTYLERYYYDHYIESAWTGIDGITDNTLGFKIVLEEDDMRLYEIAETTA